MAKQFLLVIGFLFSIQVMSQTGIGTTTPNASAKLDVYSENKGFLPPRVSIDSTKDLTSILNPAEGLLVYNTGTTGLQAGYYYWNGANWATIATASSAGNGVTAMDMVKLYSKIYTANTGIVSSNGQSFTVPVSGRYTFDFSSTGYANGNFSFIFKVMQGSTLLGADTVTSANNYVHVEYNGKIEVNLQAGVTYNVYVNSNGNRDNGDYDRVYYKLVAGNLPVTGQSVDYIQASLSANQALTTVGNINFNTSSGTGITITSGGFNLIANKTYKLEAAIGGASVGYAYYGWVDNSNNLLPGGSIGAVIKAGNVHTDAPQDKAVVYFTPSVDTRVFLRVYNLSGTLTAYAPSLSTNFSSTWASIQQVGSSAIINPWTLSGTSTSNTTGNVGIGTTTPGDLLVVGSSIALHDGGDKVVGLGWSPGSGKAILAGYPAEIRLNPSTGKLSLGTDPTSRSIGSSPGVQRRMTITSAGNTGIGTEDPTEKLEVIGNVKATNFIGTASSATLYLLEANANVTYTLPGSYTSDNCRYSIVSNTVNVPSSWFNTSTYRFTPQKAGYWEITASYDVYRNSEASLLMQKNGSNVALAGSLNAVVQQINKIIYLNGSTDYITITNSGASSYSRSQDSSKSWFQARWIGE